MAKKTITLKDFSFDLAARVDARNCRLLVIRFLAGIAALPMIASKATSWREDIARESIAIHNSTTRRIYADFVAGS